MPNILTAEHKAPWAYPSSIWFSMKLHVFYYFTKLIDQDLHMCVDVSLSLDDPAQVGVFYSRNFSCTA